jgi:hypothetical protein
LWCGSLQAIRISRGAVALVAKALFLLLTCLACIGIGFVLPMAPGVRLVIGSALWAGLLSTAGAIAGMYVSDAILARLEPSDSGVASTEQLGKSEEKTRRRL